MNGEWHAETLESSAYFPLGLPERLNSNSQHQVPITVPGSHIPSKLNFRAMAVSSLIPQERAASFWI